jgi:metal transporter CNNM
MAVEYHCCSAAFFEHIVIIVVLVLFAGLMSGLTLGLMSLSLVDLEVLAKSGTEQDRKHAGTLFLPSPPVFRGRSGPLLFSRV